MFYGYTYKPRTSAMIFDSCVLRGTITTEDVSNFAPFVFDRWTAIVSNDVANPVRR